MSQSDDLAEAVRLTLEPTAGTWTLCRDCGAVKHTVEHHICRVGPVEAEGLETDEKRRARSYAIE